MIQVIAIGGEPATGKSTLVNALIAEKRCFGEPKSIKLRTCLALHFAEEKLVVLGVYGEKLPFPGTDRLSMAVQPDALELLQRLKVHPDYFGATVLYEGDRLFNSKFLGAIRDSKIPLYPIILECTDETKKSRHWNRRDNQSPEFLKSRHTKVLNIVKNQTDVSVYNHENQADTEHVLSVIETLRNSFCPTTEGFVP